MALGYPMTQVLEQSLTANQGIVSKLVSGDLNMLHDATIDGGSSGGPCIDQFGNAIGVNYATHRTEEGGFALC